MADVSSSAGYEPTQFLSKTCSKCHEELPLETFSRSARGLHGRRGDCKACHAAHKAAARLLNLEEHRLRGRAKYRADPDAARAATSRWRAANLDHDIQRDREYKAANRELLRQKDRERIARDPELHRQRSRAYREKYPDKVRESVRRSSQKHRDKARERERKLRSTPKGRVTNTVRAAIHRGLAKGGKNGLRTFAALGFSSEKLMEHLQRQFAPGMTWDNFGEWHIDHRLPLAMFEYRTVEDPGFKAAWALTNLQPLWATDNHKKKAKRVFLL